MVINALAAQANTSLLTYVRRFLFTSRNYLGLNPMQYQSHLGVGEFVDPPRYRCDLQAPARRAAA